MCECVFCHKEQIVTDFVYEDELVMAFNEAIAELQKWGKLFIRRIYW